MQTKNDLAIAFVCQEKYMQEQYSEKNRKAVDTSSGPSGHLPLEGEGFFANEGEFHNMNGPLPTA